MAVRIADGDSIAYWQTTDRDVFDGGPFIIKNHPPTPQPARIVTLALPAPEPTPTPNADAS